MAASTVAAPPATARQNATRSSLFPAVGRPGECITGRPVIADPQPLGLPIATLLGQALRGPVEFTQYTSYDYTQTLEDHGVLASIGTVGDAYDNAVAESFVDSFKTELIAERTWATRSQLDLAVVEYVAWFNNERLHEMLDDRPPREIEDLYAAKQQATLPIK